MIHLLAHLCVYVLRASVRAIAIVLHGLQYQVLLLFRGMIRCARGVDAALEGVMWEVVVKNGWYTAVLLALYLLSPSLVRLVFRAKEALTNAVFQGLVALLTSCFGDFHPFVFPALRLAIDVLLGITWIDVVLQYALLDQSPN